MTGNREILELPEDEADTLDTLLSELGSADAPIEVRLYRAPGGANKRMSLCFTLPAEEFDLATVAEQLRDEWGPGEYQVMVRQGGKLKANRPLSIAAPISRATPVPAAPPPAPVAPDFERLLERLHTMQIESQNAMMQLMLKQGQGGGRGSELGELIEIAKLLTGNRVDPMESVKQMLEVTNLLKGEAAQPDLWTSAINGIAGPLLQMANRLQPPAGAGQRQPLPNPQGRPAADPPAAGEANQREPTPGAAESQAGAGQAQPHPLLVLQQYLPMLLNAAGHDSDPIAYAVVLCDVMPPDVLQLVVMLAQQDAALDQLAQIAPAVNNFRPWFEDLLAELAGLTSENAGADDSGEPPPGSVHATGHESTPQEPDPAPDGDGAERPGGSAPGAGNHAHDGAEGED